MRSSLAGLLLMAAGILSRPAWAQASTIDPIDTALASCLARPEAGEMAGRVACFTIARDAWAQEVATAYASLSARLDARSRGILRGSQKQWEAYGAAEQRFQAALWTRDPAMSATTTSQNVDLFRSRALMLRHYKAE